MVISCNQPYFFPYPGFFLKIRLSDISVIMDSVQFPRGGTWLTRNRLKNDKGIFWINVPVIKKGRGLQRIDQVEIAEEFYRPKKILRSIEMAYRWAPYLKDHITFLEDIFNNKRFKFLFDLNYKIIRYVMDYLSLNTQIILLSELGIDAKGEDLIIEIFKRLNGKTFLSQIHARSYLNPDRFKAEGIDLRFFRMPKLVYPQLWGDYIQNLSILDLLLNCGKKARDILFT